MTIDGISITMLCSVAGWSSLAARRAHNPKVVGSNPAPATKSIYSVLHQKESVMSIKVLLHYISLWLFLKCDIDLRLTKLNTADKNSVKCWHDESQNTLTILQSFMADILTHLAAIKINICSNRIGS